MPIDLATVLFNQAAVFSQLLDIRELPALGGTAIGQYLFTKAAVALVASRLSVPELQASGLLRRLVERNWAIGDVVDDRETDVVDGDRRGPSWFGG